LRIRSTRCFAAALPHKMAEKRTDRRARLGAPVLIAADEKIYFLPTVSENARVPMNRMQSAIRIDLLVENFPSAG